MVACASFFQRLGIGRKVLTYPFQDLMGSNRRSPRAITWCTAPGSSIRGGRDIFIHTQDNVINQRLTPFPPGASPTAERIDQIVGEDEAAALPLGETLVDDLFSAVLRRFGHLHAEAAAAKRGLTPRTSP